MWRAESAGRWAARVLAGQTTGVVAGRHATSAHLLGDDGELLVLATPELGWGPLHLIIPAAALEQTRRGDRFRVTPGALTVGDVTVSCAHTPLRTQGVAWPVLAAGFRQTPGELIAYAQRATESAWRALASPHLETTLHRLAAAVSAAAASGSAAERSAAIAAMCGVGPGLTPAGDDWLGGWLLGGRLISATRAEDWDRAVRRALPGRTTRLSAAHLLCAAAGEVDAGWERLLEAFAGLLPPADADVAIRKALARGATSGVAAVSGCLCALEAAPAGRPTGREVA